MTFRLPHRPYMVFNTPTLLSRYFARYQHLVAAKQDYILFHDIFHHLEQTREDLPRAAALLDLLVDLCLRAFRQEVFRALEQAQPKQPLSQSGLQKALQGEVPLTAMGFRQVLKRAPLETEYQYISSQKAIVADVGVLFSWLWGWARDGNYGEYRFLRTHWVLPYPSKQRFWSRTTGIPGRDGQRQNKLQVWASVHPWVMKYYQEHPQPRSEIPLDHINQLPITGWRQSPAPAWLTVCLPGIPTDPTILSTSIDAPPLTAELPLPAIKHAYLCRQLRPRAGDSSLPRDWLIEYLPVFSKNVSHQFQVESHSLRTPTRNTALEPVATVLPLGPAASAVQLEEDSDPENLGHRQRTEDASMDPTQFEAQKEQDIRKTESRQQEILDAMSSVSQAMSEIYQKKVMQNITPLPGSLTPGSLIQHGYPAFLPPLIGRAPRVPPPLSVRGSAKDHKRSPQLAYSLVTIRLIYCPLSSHASPGPAAVRIVEVGPRDGLQNVRNLVDTATKTQLIYRLQQAGHRTIGLTSFVSPKGIPQLADAQRDLGDRGIKALLQDSGLNLPILVLNLKGLEKAIASGVKEVAVFVSATEGFRKANINCTVEEGLERARAVVRKATESGIIVRGLPPPSRAVAGVPSDVRRLLSYPETNEILMQKLAGHFHDIYGSADTNAWEAYKCGIRVSDGSIAGLGAGLQIYRSGVNLKLVLNQPKNGNALTSAMITDPTAQVRDTDSDIETSRLIITVNSKYFCTGMDLASRSTLVTIGCLNGPAFGGSVRLAFACDIQVAMRDSGVTLSGVKLGLSPATISKYVIWEWGFAFAREAMLSARRVTAEELRQRGIVSQLAASASKLGATLDELLNQLKFASLEGSRMSKQLVRLAWANTSNQAQGEGIRAVFNAMRRPDAEGAYGVKEFQANRPVDWDTYSLGWALRAKL
ncbi:hypothetical protein BJY01DRAFT_246100 [Aspergillus pseudoustus]|uniref:hydroxymethylglutaryl-CoA lyase n=1 Tax=Aspergillus pseudoustus TaxID=1810923 RepID=A0ABR4K9P2_9EURO